MQYFNMTNLQKRVNKLVDNYIDKCFSFRKFGITFDYFYKLMTSKKEELICEFADKFTFAMSDEIFQSALSVFKEEAEILLCEAQQMKNTAPNTFKYLKDINMYTGHCDNMCAEGKKIYLFKIFKHRKRAVK